MACSEEKAARSYRSYGCNDDQHFLLAELPKKSLPGSVHVAWQRCGKPTCRCANGEPHGPYYYRHQRVCGRQVKTYVKREELFVTLLATQAHRREDQQLDDVRSCLRAIAETLSMEI